MAEEEFEIDVYGDSANDHGDNGHGDHGHGDHGQSHGDDQGYEGEDAHDTNGDHGHHEDYHEDDRENTMDDGGADQTQSQSPAPQRPQQGVKRKEGSDDRPVDPGATTVLMVSELNWWNTDDDIRGWVRQAGCETELKDITFSEHKINGKSKGQAYVEFTSQQAATATKHRIDTLNNEYSQPGQKRHTVIYSAPTHNPFRTLPKDAPNRGAKDGQGRGAPGAGYNDRGGNFGGGNTNYSGGFRGGRGGYNNPRGGGGGGGMNQGGFNRNFAGSNMNSFNANNMGFSNPMGGGGGFGGGFNRGGMMGGGGMRGGGMRGGRGGGGMGMMGGMPMAGGMPMGGMAGPMGGMGMMGGGMGGGMPGFQGMQPGFNPAFFGGGGANQPNEWQNPHGAKRARGE